MTVTDTELINTVTQALTDDASVTDEIAYVVLAALEGDAELASELHGTVEHEALQPDSPASQDGPVGAFVSCIEVTGFRGIGPTSKFSLVPGPGITVVSGRNGSGKSSFAEALEFALTSKSYRWSANKKSVVWASSWRNMHHDGEASIRVGLTIDGRPETTVGVDWSAGAELDDAAFWVQEKKAARSTGTDTLGWRDALDSHRPILSYDEVGRMFEQEPSALYDAIAKLLGLDAVAAAEKRLAERHGELKKPRTAATQSKKSVKQAVEASSDERAAAAFQQLRKHKPDLDVVAGIATGSEAASSTVVAALRRLATLRTVEVGDIEHAVAQFDTARDALSAVTGVVADTQERLLDLLSAALELHPGGDGRPCPVCGEGTLDDAWAERSRLTLEAGRTDTQRYRDAKSDFDAAARSLRDLALSAPPADDDTGGVDLEVYRAARDTARTVPSDATSLGDHVTASLPVLIEAAAGVREQAAQALAQLETEWTPLAEQLARWVDLEREARAVEEQLTRVDAARSWLTGHIDVLRDERLAPIGDQARRIWSMLRQESNVDIGRITLEGRATRRKATIEASVDGQSTGALSVMSQGELHALTLALFIPRATTEGSPFRFLVLDDPIQAMDPAKIDGFVDVLVDLAATRQVVVFSHDDRLPAALRRRSIGARLVEVTREAKSSVRLAEADTPAQRYVADVHATVRDELLPDEVKRRAVQAIFRLAIEAAAWDRYVRTRTADGTAWVDLERTWSETQKTRGRIALAMGKSDQEIGAWLSYREWRGGSLHYANKGVHGAGSIPTKSHASDLNKLVDELLAVQ